MARVEYRFPLVLWEQTEDYAKQEAAAKVRFGELAEEVAKKRITPYSPEVTFTQNGIPVVFKNQDTPYYERQHLTASEALEHATYYGAAGRFTAEEIEEYIDGKGVIVEMEMDELGFRRSKKDASTWVRKQKGDPDRELAHTHWDKLWGIDYDIPDLEERERLESLRVGNNARTRLGDTYSVSVGRTGLIFVAKDVQPFTLRPGDLIAQTLQRAHINDEQEGFLIRARNVILEKSQEAVHIKAIRPDETVEEVVWPGTVAHGGVIIDLAVDLRAKARRRQAYHA